MQIDVTSMEGHARTFRFKHADVTVPIMSIGLLADHDNDTLFQKRGGKIIHVRRGEIIHFQRMHGVYFVKFKVDAHILNPPPPPPPSAVEHQDFHAGVAR